MSDLEKNIRALQEAMTVTSAMQLRQESQLKQHQVWLEEEQHAIARHRIWLEEHEATMREHEAAMRRVDDQLEKIAELILRGRGGNGHE